MTPQTLKETRLRLRLSAAQLGRLLELEGRDPGRTVLRWEAGNEAIPGPARVALRYVLAEAAQAAVATLVAATPPTPVPEPPQARDKAPKKAAVAHAVALGIQQDRQRRDAEAMPPVHMVPPSNRRRRG